MVHICRTIRRSQTSLTRFLVMMFLGLLFPNLGHAVTTPCAIQDLDKIEVGIWLSEDENELQPLENCLTKIIQLQPTLDTPFALLSMIYLKSYNLSPGKLTLLRKSAELADQAFQLDPTSDSAVVSLSLLFEATEQKDKSILLLNEFEKENPKSAAQSWRIRFLKAKYANPDKNPEKIIALLKSSAQLAVGQQQIIPSLYLLSFLNDKFDDDYIESFLNQIDQTEVNIVFNMARMNILMDQRKYIAAEKFLGKIPDSNFLFHTANLDFIENAVEYLDQNPSAKIKKDGNLSLKNSVASKIKNLQNSLLSFSHSQKIRWYKIKGDHFLSTKKLAAAQKNFRTAFNSLETDRIDSKRKMIELISLSYKIHKEMKGYLEFLESIANDSPSEDYIFAEIARVERDHFNDFSRSNDFFAKALLIDPTNILYMNDLGINYYHEKKFDRALRVFQKAVKTNQRNALAHYNSACMQALLGQYDQALASLTQAVTIDPLLKERARSDADFVELRRRDKFRSLVASTD